MLILFLPTQDGSLYLAGPGPFIAAAMGTLGLVSDAYGAMIKC